MMAEIEPSRSIPLPVLTNSDFPAFSPDGTRIAFSRRGSGSCEPGEACNFSIYVIDPDGTNETQITDVDGVDNNPAWSPEGTRIAFFSTREDPIERINWDIYVMNPDDSNTSLVTDHAGIDQFPAWSPDGTRILFQSDRSGISQLYTTTLDGSARPTKGERSSH